jgi:hypothetical protein
MRFERELGEDFFTRIGTPSGKYSVYCPCVLNVLTLRVSARRALLRVGPRKGAANHSSASDRGPH